MIEMDKEDEKVATVFLKSILRRALRSSDAVGQAENVIIVL